MPASIKLQAEYGDDLAVLFVESQGTTPEATGQFIMKQRWLGNSTMWTNERPFNTGAGGLPNFALLSAEGKVLVKGSHIGSAEKEMIEAEIKAATDAPEGTPKDLAKVWKTFNKGGIAKAIEEAQKLAIKKPDLAADAEATIKEFENRVQSRLDRVTWLIDNGHPLDAKSKLAELMKEVKGADSLFASAMEVENRFNEDSMKLELEADAAIGRALDKLFEDGRDEKLFEKVESMADKYSGTKVAARAQKFVAMRTLD